MCLYLVQSISLAFKPKPVLQLNYLVFWVELGHKYRYYIKEIIQKEKCKLQRVITYIA